MAISISEVKKKKRTGLFQSVTTHVDTYVFLC